MKLIADLSRHPFESRPRSNRRLVFICLVIAALLPAVASAVVQPLHEDATGETIIDFEFAGTVERAEEILAAWEAEGVVDDAKAIQLFDLIYPLIYSFALAAGCVAAAGAWRRHGRETWAQVGIAMAWMAFVAAGFDYLENLGIAVSLWGEPVSPWPELTLVAAIVKFGGIAVSLAYALTGIFAWLSTRGRGPASGPPRTPLPGSP